MTARHYTNSQNSIISFGYVDFWAKIFLILYPALENSANLIAILIGEVGGILGLTLGASAMSLIESLFQRCLSFFEKKNKIEETPKKSISQSPMSASKNTADEDACYVSNVW